MDGCKSNPEKVYTTKVGKYIPPGFSMSTILSFKGIKSKYGVCRGEHYRKRVCECLKKHAKKVINFKKKKMKLLMNKHQESYKKGKV